MPVGLTLGSVPFILRTKVSYTEIGVFSLASYPYSLKVYGNNVHLVWRLVVVGAVVAVVRMTKLVCGLYCVVSWYLCLVALVTHCGLSILPTHWEEKELATPHATFHRHPHVLLRQLCRALAR